MMTRRGFFPRSGEYAALAGSTLLFAIAFPPFPLLVPAFFCLVPFAVAVATRADGEGTRREAARLGFWFGMLGYACNLYWIAIALSIYTKLAIVGYIAALFVLAPIVALAGLSLFVLRRRTRLPLAILLPVVWVASEVVLNYMSDLAFPWLPLGLALSRTPVLAQMADISGVRGLSFLIALANGLIADAWLLRGQRVAIAKRLAGAIAIVAVMAAYGSWRMRTTALVSVAPIAIVQPNIPQEDKWQAENQGRIQGILDDITMKRIAQHDAKLILWPEASLPGFISDHPEWSSAMRRMAAVSHTPILFGTLDLVWHGPGDYDYYNAAMLVDSAGVLNAQEPYRKSYLVPIVERVPFVNPRWFKKLKYFGGYGRGQNTKPFTLSFGKVGVLICYESIFPQRSREFRREGASIIVNITNDAWFGRSLAPYQHEAHMALRAIENRVGIVRAANTGISGYIDPLGRISGETQLDVADSRVYNAQTTSVTTLYVRIGDWIGTLALALTIAGLIWARVRRQTA
ncbi:MAG: apolipoprotein N-acyltransferase [Gemmatimonadaceae bacterium]|nr:apolipoprotein N-acyltransferase [Gemmatimonadaceae bacterium]